MSQKVYNNQLSINNSSNEGECKIEGIYGYKLNIGKVIGSVFLCILSVSILAIIFRFSLKMRLLFLYSPVKIQDASSFLIENSDGISNIVSKQVEGNNILFTNRHLKYYYDENQQNFKAQTKKFVDGQDFKGINKNEIVNQKEKYGPCKIDIPIQGLGSFMIETLTKPFFFFQYFTSLVWIAEGFIYFAVIMVIVSLVITLIDYYFMRQSLMQLRKLAQVQPTVQVFRPQNNKEINWQTDDISQFIENIQSVEIVPGDLLILQEHQIPCDMVLLSGELLVNEANLTGESIPIPKESLKNFEQNMINKENDTFEYQEYSGSVLFEGTKIIQIKPTQNKYVVGIAMRTGFSSFKGQIFRKMLYPKPTNFEFYNSGIKMALILVVLAVIVFFCFLPKMIDLDIPFILIFLRFCDTITWLLPPALPIFYAICQTFAVYRLRNQQIIAIDTEKTVVAGGIQIMCFDKTGTLTNTGMEVFGYNPLNYGENDNTIQPLQHQNSKKQIDQNQILFQLFSTCHGVYKIKNELLGDELDVEMFKFSQYNIEDSKNADIKFVVEHQECQQKLEVYKTFEFQSELQRMSCVAKDVNNNKLYGFVKGSPEKIKTLCIQNQLPQDYDQQMQNLAIKGLRIIALGYRILQDSDNNYNNIQDIKRDDIEKDLQFLGFFVLQNKLKDDTKDCILNLKSSNLECKVISGDNALTTAQTARECGILPQNSSIYVLDYNSESNLIDIQKLSLGDSTNSDIQQNNSSMFNQEQHDKLNIKKKNSKDDIINRIQQNNDMNDIQLQNLNFKGKTNEEQIKNIESIISYPNTDIALSGVFYQWIETNAPQLLDNICIKTRVFSRMKPFQKNKVISVLQQNGFKVGMIGDGINDSAAIKQAHIGISFAQADSSFSATFTSQSQSIDCIEKILLQGRGTMQNLIETYYYLIIGSVMKYVNVQIMLYEVSNHPEFQWVFMNYLNALPLLFFLSFSRPVKKINNNIPEINFLSLQTICVLSGQIVFYIIQQIIIYQIYISKDWYVQNKDLNEDDLWNYETQVPSVLFLPSQIYYLASLIALYTSRPFKEYIFQNIALTIFILLVFIYVVLMFFSEGAVMGLLNMNTDQYDDGNFMFVLFIISICMAIVIILYQELIINKFFVYKKIIVKNFHLKQLKKND